MEDCRVARLRALAVARPTEAARLNEEVDAVLAARTAGQSLWGSELPPLFLRLVLERLQWDPAVCGVMRLVCSTWSSILDALLPGRLEPNNWTWGWAAMDGKLRWFESVTEVDLLKARCVEKEDVSGVLAELASMPSLRSLVLPASCVERVVDAEAVYSLTTLTTLRFVKVFDVDGFPMEVGEWVLDFSRLPTLTSLHLEECAAVTDKQVQELSSLTGLTSLYVDDCRNVTIDGLLAVIK
jgi:hypothetical protein